VAAATAVQVKLADLAIDLHAANLVVRRVQASDLPALMDVNGDDEVTRHLPYASWRSIDDATAWLERMRGLEEAGACCQYVIVDKVLDQAIGTALLFRWEPASARAELGYVLGRAHWGRGRMQEALGALIRFAFDGLELNRLEAEVNPANTASRALLKRLGFQQEGVLRERWAAKGRTYDVIMYSLLRREWLAPPAT
jgi:[ribosomal protein S5]-alanine N-acetyltransferase